MTCIWVFGCSSVLIISLTILVNLGPQIPPESNSLCYSRTYIRHKNNTTEKKGNKHRGWREDWWYMFEAMSGRGGEQMETEQWWWISRGRETGRDNGTDRDMDNHVVRGSPLIKAFLSCCAYSDYNDIFTEAWSTPIKPTLILSELSPAGHSKQTVMYMMAEGGVNGLPVQTRIIKMDTFRQPTPSIDMLAG